MSIIYIYSRDFLNRNILTHIFFHMYYAIAMFVYQNASAWLVISSKSPSWSGVIIDNVILEKYWRSFHLRTITDTNKADHQWGNIYMDETELTFDEKVAAKVAKNILKKLLINIVYPEWELKKSILESLRAKKTDE